MEIWGKLLSNLVILWAKFHHFWFPRSPGQTNKHSHKRLIEKDCVSVTCKWNCNVKFPLAVLALILTFHSFALAVLALIPTFHSYSLCSFHSLPPSNGRFKSVTIERRQQYDRRRHTTGCGPQPVWLSQVLEYIHGKNRISQLQDECHRS
jgi:hypothetical protein